MQKIGIDLGSLFIKLVTLTPSGELAETRYLPHKGDPIRALKEALNSLEDLQTEGVVFGFTGTNARLVTTRPVDWIQAELAIIRRIFPRVRNVIDVGGGSLTLIRLDEEGKFRDYATNSLCAAGTGSFLDEQAARLGIDYDELKNFSFLEEPPSIATRCSVFAKSDLIHRQQEGHSREAMWSGLCRGLTHTFMQTLLGGKPLDGLTVLTGGVSLNPEVLRWLRSSYGEIETYQGAHLAAAHGAALRAEEKIDWKSIEERQEGSEERRRPPLKLIRSLYPDFAVQESYLDADDNEVRVSNWPKGKKIEGYLGIDVGSTSTKLALVDREDRVIADIYRKTMGDPIGATKKIFQALVELGRNQGEIDILGCGTTGSGRKLVGAVIGADAVINEISAHVSGAMKVDPSIDTLIEIGGQDAKYMHTIDGRIHDSNMNYVCAAGTGSFVEEQAKKLGFDIREAGDKVMNIAPPFTSDRCTVFMEQDIHKLIRQGFEKEECLAAVMYSIAQNYLNKVVGNRTINPKKIFFQGATARNKGLVAAFENLLGVEVVVSPYCHVMGAYGVAILTHARLKDSGKTSFKGLDLAERKIELSSETCSLCQNKCKITSAHIEGEKDAPSWGYMCGREPDEARLKVNEAFKPFEIRQKMLFQAGAKKEKKIGIPRSLAMYSYFPTWRKFLEVLGYEAILSPETNEKIKEAGTHLKGADFCFPVKAAHGHLKYFIDLPEEKAVDFVLVPFLISNEPNKESTNSHFCPYVQCQPGYLKAALALNGHGEFSEKKLLSPVVDLRLNDKKVVKDLFDSLGGPLQCSEKAIAQAWQEAKKAQLEFDKRCEAEGKRILSELEKSGKKAIVFLGRPYNTFDLGSNLQLPRKISELGYTVLPLDFLPVEGLRKEYENIYWSYPQRIMKAVEVIRNHPNLFAIYLTNFNCGPDSFVLTFAEHAMGNKPMLILELDEHGADTGYITRVEAFMDVLAGNVSKPSDAPVQIPLVSIKDMKKRKLYIPPLHYPGNRLFAAAFRSEGYDAECLPQETRETFELGRSLTRGSECLPMALTAGTLHARLKEVGADPKKSALFMATENGPCRFGQYTLMHRLVLDRLGYAEMPILSPTYYNTYQGIEPLLRPKLFSAMVLADILYKALLKVRPYEINPGETDEVYLEGIGKLEKAMESNWKLKPAVRQVLESIQEVPQKRTKRPLVGVVGEIYIRLNLFGNGGLDRAIERYGGEAWFAPSAEWIFYSAAMQKWLAREGITPWWDRGSSYLENIFINSVEDDWMRLAGDFLSDRHEPSVEEVLTVGKKYLPFNHHGETLLTIGRAAKFVEAKAELIVNCAPFGCMPGTLTSALFQRLQEEWGVPVANLMYDGNGHVNDRLEVFLNNLKQKKGTRELVRQ